MTPAAGPNGAAQVLDTAERLIAAGQWGEAVDLLTDANRRAPAPEIEVRLVSARHRTFVAPPAAAPTGPWPVPVADAFPDIAGLPEVAASELNAELLGAGLQHHGALIVRGLLSPSVAESLLAEIRRAFDAAEAAAAGAPVSETSPWYVPFEPGEGYDFGWVERHFSRRVGAVLAVEAPRALFHVIETLRAAGLGELIGEYVGEWPALSAKKTSLRRARPDSPTEWHQDGAFLGEGIRTVNAWTALTPCGRDAPGIEVYARPFDEIVTTGTDDALFKWSVSPEQAERLGTGDIVSPEFAAGDALLFNQLTLHRTGIAPTMTRERYAIESWFFAPSTYPLEQVPIAF
jgi:Phytanoyl-CoA dioxygenase (PhyH)